MLMNASVNSNVYSFMFFLFCLLSKFVIRLIGVMAFYPCGKVSFFIPLTCDLMTLEKASY